MNLVLTFDYELFGDGSGDVFIDMIEPTNKILKICKRYNIKTTFFFEVIEYIKLKEEWNKGNKMGYTQNPIEAIEKQIQNAVLTGHDIQLHIHPQWVKADYTNNKWNVDFNNWRLGDFNIGSNYKIFDLIKESKDVLEKLIQKVKPDYKCLALRAGGYNILPSEEIHKAMRMIGLKVDGSVYAGGFENGSLSKFDYQNVSLDLDYWWADKKDIRNTSSNDKEILEVPIFALPVSRWKKIITFSKIKSILLGKNNVISPTSKENIKNKTISEKIKYLINKEAYTWDVCMFSKSLHKKYLTLIEKKLARHRRNFVLIGHPKSLHDEKHFKNFMVLIQRRQEQYTFKTLSQYYEEII